MDVIFPPKCLGCSTYLKLKRTGDSGFAQGINRLSLKGEALFKTVMAEFFCSSCLDLGFKAFGPPFCLKCGRGFATINDENHLCSTCMASPGTKLRVRAVAGYEGVVKKSLHLFKYSGKIQLSSPLGWVLFKAFRDYYGGEYTDIILPVPLHRKRLKKRGFNQAYLLVKDFKRLWHLCENKPPPWRIKPFLLARTKHTRSQTGFNKKERKENIAGAFKVTDKAAVQNRNILVVDDVYTTGATAREAAATLLDAGAAAVDVLVFARV